MKGYIKISSENHIGPMCVECNAQMRSFIDSCNVVDALLEAVCKDPEDKKEVLAAVTASVLMESITGESSSQKIVYPTPDAASSNVGIDKDFLNFLKRRGRDDG